MPELVAGSGITLVKNPVTDELTISGGGGGSSFGAIDVSALPGFVADETTTNDAAIIEAAAAAIPSTRGVKVIHSAGLRKWNRQPSLNRPSVIEGQGRSSNTSATDGATILQFPAGVNGTDFLHTPGAPAGAQKSIIRNLTLYQPTGLSTTATANYTAGSSTIAITGGTNDYVAKQGIRLEGAGPSFTPPGKTAAITSGNNVATITSLGGNPGVYVGQPIKIPGAGAAGADLNGFVGAWGSTSITIVNAAGAALNAGTPVSGVQYTIIWPLINRIASVAGSTITLAQTPSNSQSVTGGVLKHADCGIYGSCSFKVEDVMIAGFDIGEFRHGETAGGAIADDGSSYDTTYAARWGGVVFVGQDAQQNTHFKPNLAGPLVSWLDMSLIGNVAYDPHLAFNCGFVSVFASQTLSALHSPYVEGGTGMSSAGATWSFGGIGMRNGLGINHLGNTDDIVGTGNAPPMVIGGARGQFTVPELYAGGRSIFKGTGRLVFQNDDGPTADGVSGKGLHVFRDANRQYVIAYNVSTPGYAQLRISGSDVQIAPNDTVVATVDSTSLNLASGIVHKINGTQVLGARRTGWTAATGTATRTTFDTASVTLPQLAEHVKALIDDFIALGPIGA